MTVLFKSFAADDAGAVTVDWVVLTAALVGLAIGILNIISFGIRDAANEIPQDLAAINQMNLFEVPSGGTGDGGEDQE